jgi:hypothetical protein
MGYLERIVPLVQLSVHNYFVASNTFWKTANPVKVRKYWMATGIRPGYDQSTSIVTESTMRIVYGLTTLGLGGAERQALAVAEAMERRGHGVVLLVLGPRLERECRAARDAQESHQLAVRVLSSATISARLSSRSVAQSLRALQSLRSSSATMGCKCTCDFDGT